MKNIAVRYCSKTKAGNTKRIAEAIAKGAGVKAISIDDEPYLTEEADVLFLGGAPYANIMAPELREYAENLPAFIIKEVRLFTTSNWSKRTVKALKEILSNKGIKVQEDFFYAHMLNIEGKLQEAEAYGRNAAE